MATMTMAATNRARIGCRDICHPECDSCNARPNIKPLRRRMRRLERQAWKAEVRRYV